MATSDDRQCNYGAITWMHILPGFLARAHSALNAYDVSRTRGGASLYTTLDSPRQPRSVGAQGRLTWSGAPHFSARATRPVRVGLRRGPETR